ncbi:MAG: lysophospholipid acyltransferase family protein [Robiginitomaculum sp.]|nr:lysophospholipid acyltransferase family protein [Robiginitomaculum sp.]
MMKKFFRSRPVQFMLAVLLTGYIKLVKHTTRWQIEGHEVIKPIWADGKGAIAVLWHSRVLLLAPVWPQDKPPTKQTPSILISLSPDGAFITKAVQMLGVEVIRGSASNKSKSSKNKGNLSAFRKMIDHINNNGCMAITPDGPRGPRMRASMGAIQLAAKTGAPIICLGCSTNRAKFFNSWDRFCLPFPFAKGVIVWEGTIFVNKDADAAEMENNRQQMEGMINCATRRADIACGHKPIEPSAKDGS